MTSRLNAPALGVAIGCLWGIVVPVITWLNAMTGGLGAHQGWFAPCVKALDYAIPGYYAGFFGGIWGGIWVFCVGIVVGTFVGTVYNRLAAPVEETVVVGMEIDEE